MSTSNKYVCKKCKSTFANQGNLTKHMNRKTPCNKKTDYKCNKCHKTFIRKDHYESHQNRKTPCVPEIKDTSTTVDNEENKCKYCGETLAHKYSLKRHYKSCKVKKTPNIMEERFIKIIEDQQKQLKEQQHQLTELIHSQQPTVINNNNTLNQTINDNRQLNITLVNFGKEDLSYITPEFIAGLFDTHGAEQIIPTIIKKIHADPDHPENHNIYMLSREDEHAMVYGPLPKDPSTLDWYPKSIGDTKCELTNKAHDLMFYENGIPKQDIVAVMSDEGYEKVPVVSQLQFEELPVLEKCS